VSLRDERADQVVTYLTTGTGEEYLHSRRA
jgi:hypothetical protein